MLVLLRTTVLPAQLKPLSLLLSLLQLKSHSPVLFLQYDNIAAQRARVHTDNNTIHISRQRREHWLDCLHARIRKILPPLAEPYKQPKQSNHHVLYQRLCW